MFGLFRPRCPLDVREKTWVDLRMAWLVERLGYHAIRDIEVLTPSSKHFPDAYSRSDQDIEHIFGRVCEQMRVPRDTVKLELFDGEDRSPFSYRNRGSYLGAYEQRETGADRHTIWIERTHTADPMHLISTAAHEVAHLILLGDGLLNSDDADHEFVTDLLPVVRGLGVFAANATLLEESYQIDRSRWRSVSKKGYLPSRMFGYALGVFAWLRDECKPAWAGYLRGDPYSVFKSALGYLKKTGDCLDLNPSGQPRESSRSLHVRLNSENSGARLSAFWELRRPDAVKLGENEWTALVECLDDRDLIHLSEAARAIAAIGRADIRVARKCIDLLVRHATETEVLSCLALVLATQSGAFAQDESLLPIVAEELLKLLQHESPTVVASALTALGRLEPKLDELDMNAIVGALRDGLVKCNDEVAGGAARALHAVCEAPHELVRAALAADLELWNAAHVALSAGERDNHVVDRIRLPTNASLPVPLPYWRPQFEPQPDPAADVVPPPSDPG